MQWSKPMVTWGFLLSLMTHLNTRSWTTQSSKLSKIAPDPELADAREIVLRIRRRQLYQFCNEYAVPKDKIDHFKPVTAQDIICSQKHASLTLKEEDIAVTNVKIDLARGRQNPLECIKFFKDYESEEKFVIPYERVSHLLPTTYQDMIVRVYAKKPELVEAVSEAFENFQMRTYGIKAQVHVKNSIGLKHSYDAPTVAQVLDMDKLFTGRFWTEMFRLSEAWRRS